MGNDTLYGQCGNDLIDSGNGDGALNGRAGPNQFQFRSAHRVDIIADFSAEDRLIVTQNVNDQPIDPASLDDRRQDLGDT